MNERLVLVVIVSATLAYASNASADSVYEAPAAAAKSSSVRSPSPELPAAASTSSPLSQVPLIIGDSDHLTVLEYEAWFGPNLIKPTAGYFPLLKSANMVGGGYDSTDPAILDQHVRWIEELGFDAILVEQSNGGPCAFGSDETCKRSMASERKRAGWEDTSVSDEHMKIQQSVIRGINANTLAVYNAFSERGTELKIVPMMDGQDPEMYDQEADGRIAFDAQVEQFLARMRQFPALNVIYEGKPLMAVYVATNSSVYHPKAMAATQKWADQVTFRIVTGFQDSQPHLWKEGSGKLGLHEITYENLWTWIDRSNPAHNLAQGYKMKGAKVEAFTVTGAAGGTQGPDGWKFHDATLWKDGETLRRNMSLATQLDPTFLIFNQFNEFATGDQGEDYEHSNDIEPTKEWGDKKFQLTKQLIREYRSQYQNRERRVIGMIDQVTPQEIRGWACEKFSSAPLQVHLYVNGTSNDGGVMVKAVEAKGRSELSVNQKCRANGQSYRFSIPLDADLLKKYGDQKIFVHGISQAGGANHTLDRSGEFFMPSGGGGEHTASTYVPRFYNATTGEHFYTRDPSEALRYGFHEEAKSGLRVMPVGYKGTIPIYRCYDGKMHYVSPRADCEGNGSNEGVYGGVFSDAQAGTVPLYRYFNPTSGDHFLNFGDGPIQGYRAESLIGHMPAN